MDYYSKIEKDEERIKQMNAWYNGEDGDEDRDELDRLKNLNLEDWISEWHKIQKEKEEREKRCEEYEKRQKQRYEDYKEKIRENEKLENEKLEFEKEKKYWEDHKIWNKSFFDNE